MTPPAIAEGKLRPALVVGLAFGFALAALAAAVPWALRLPLPTTTDEAHYLKYLWHDRDRFEQGGLHKLVTGMILDDRTRPPAYRIGVSPWIALVNVNFAQLRLLSMLWLVFSAVVVGLTVHRFTRSWPAAAVAAALAMLSTKVLLSTIHFGTEYAYYFATALSFYGLLRDWDNPSPRKLAWIWLALGLAVSALSKASFFVLPFASLSIVLLLWWFKRVRGPGLGYLIKAAAAAMILAAPWWVYNFQPAMAFAKISVSFRGRTFGPLLYLLELFRFEIGWPVSLLMTAAILTVALRWRPNRTSQVHLVLLMLLVSAGALIGVQMFSTNQDGRLISNAFFPLAIAGGIAIADRGWLRRTGGAIAVIATIALQAVLLAGPPGLVSGVTTSVPLLASSHHPPLRDWPTCDWEPVRLACAARGLNAPTIAVMGYSDTFNSDQLQIPWAIHGHDISVSQLWRWDLGDYDFASAMARAKNCEVVITVPALMTGDIDQSNTYDAAFNTAITADPAFGAPAVIQVGGANPIDVNLFFRHPEH